MTLDEAFERLRAAREVTPKTPRLPTAEEVDEAERDLGVRFHPDFRRFQLEVSNVSCGVLEPSVARLDAQPYINLRKVATGGWRLGVPRDALPFCQDNGDYFFITREGRVGLWDHNNAGCALPRCETLADWIIDDWIGADDADAS